MRPNKCFVQLYNPYTQLLVMYAFLTTICSSCSLFQISLSENPGQSGGNAMLSETLSFDIKQWNINSDHFSPFRGMYDIPWHFSQGIPGKVVNIHPLINTTKRIDLVIATLSMRGCCAYISCYVPYFVAVTALWGTLWPQAK